MTPRYDTVRCQCGNLIEMDPIDGAPGTVTYWGEDGPVEVWCCGCDGRVWVQQHVTRRYTVVDDGP